MFKCLSLSLDHHPFDVKTPLELEIVTIEPESSSIESCSWNSIHGTRIEKD